MVSKEQLKKMRCEYQVMMDQYMDRLSTSVNDSEKASREVVYTSPNTIVMLGFGDKGESSEVKDDTFQKDVIHVDGAYDIDYHKGGKESFNSKNAYTRVEPMVDFTAKSTSDKTVNLILLRKIAPFILFVLLLGCSVTYNSIKHIVINSKPNTDSPK